MIPQKRYYGKGRIAHFSPPTLQTGAKMVNCYVNFVELLQIKAAIDDAVTHMDRGGVQTTLHKVVVACGLKKRSRPTVFATAMPLT